MLLMLSSIFITCSKEKVELIPATLKGYDPRDCACCGGMMVSFPSDTGSTGSNFYLWDNIPQSYHFDQDTFPINVKISYKLLPQGCAAAKGKIEIIELQRI